MANKEMPLSILRPVWVDLKPLVCLHVLADEAVPGVESLRGFSWNETSIIDLTGYGDSV